VTGRTFIDQWMKIDVAVASNRTVSAKIAELAQRARLLVAASLTEQQLLLHVFSFSCSHVPNSW
jgi:hypothetical protein